MMMNANITKEDTAVHSESLVYKSIRTLQLDKAQDHVDQGHYISTDGKRVDWVVAMDGHGNNSCINTIRKADMNSVMSCENPAQELQKTIDKDTNIMPITKLNSGATFICAKMYETGEHINIDISYAGDSIAIIIHNGKNIFTTEPHTLKHTKQMTRLIKKGVVSASDMTMFQGSGFELLNSDTLICKKGEYIKLKTNQEPLGFFTMVPASSLGHNGLYGLLDVDTVKFKFKKTDTIRVILMSDGVSDVVTTRDKIFVEAKSSTDIVNYAHDRWSQTWNCISGNDFSNMFQTKFPEKNGYDDCCVALMERKPYVKEDSILHVDSVLDIELVEVENVCEMLKYSVEIGAAIDLVK